MLSNDVDAYEAFLGSEDVSLYEIPLERAVSSQNIDLVLTIIEAGQHLQNWSICLAASLEKAAELHNLEIASLLLSRGADPSRGRYEAPLTYAVESNNIELVELLLSKGAFVDPKSCGSDCTPLITASGWGHLELVKLLVSAGADVNYVSTEPPHLGALGYAASRGHIEVYEYLLPLVSDREEIKFAKEEIYFLQNNIVREEVWLE